MKREERQKKEIKEAIRILKSGGVVIFPTETSYGIGCDATNSKAVRRVFALKGRPEGKGTPVIVDSLQAAKRYAVFSKEAEGLAKKYWPGALTLVMPVRAGSVARACLQDGSIALRVSSHPIARALCKGLGRPIVATSANRSGEPPAYSVRQLPPLPRIFILDAGTLPKRRASTLVRIEEGKPVVLRQGPIRI